MAATEKAIDSVIWATRFIKNMPLYQVQLEVVNDAAKYFWKAAPWRWTLGDLPTVTLANTTQDYAVTLPADFEYAEDAALGFTDKVHKSIDIVPFLPNDSDHYGQPAMLSITGETVTGSYRFSPVPNGYGAGTLPSLTGTYKKKYTKLDETSLFTAGSLIFPDIYIDCFRACLLYYAYVYGDDQRAGNVQVSGGNATYTGQRAVMENAINMVRENEPLPLETVKTAVDPKKGKPNA